MQGFWINIYKPKGINSTKVTNCVKKMFKPLKVGHAGTLDPLAEGILPIAVGEATKSIEFLHNCTKTYDFEVIFGKKTDSGDLEGNIIMENDIIPSESDIRKHLPDFLGKTKQIPPKYSAIKIDGKRAYDLARNNIEFEMKEREVEIFDLNMLNYSKERAYFRATVSLGTYIRTLAEDIVEKAGGICVVSELKRVSYGKFGTEGSLALKIDDNKNIIDDLQTLKKSIIKHAQPVDVGLDDIPVLHLDNVKIKRLRQGQRLRMEAVDGLYRVYEGDEFSLIANLTGGVCSPYKVYNL